MSFNPNRLSFDDGLRIMNAAAEKHGVDRKKILTSRDPNVAAACQDLAVRNVPDGFNKWMLPVHLDCASQQYLSFAGPNVKVGSHSHDEGDGIRFIIQGSIEYDGKILSEGDWMFVPKGAPYEFKVGPRGAGFCYCYCCCCQ